MEKFIFANKHTWDRLTAWERADRKKKKVERQNRRKGR